MFDNLFNWGATPTQKTEDAPMPQGAVGELTAIADKIDPLESQVDDSQPWVDPPVDFDDLANLYNLNSLHRSCLVFKSQAIVQGYRPHEANKHYMEKPQKGASKQQITAYAQNIREFQMMLSRENLYSYILDYLIFGNATLEKLAPKGGGKKTVGLDYRNIRTMRVGKKDNVFYEVVESEIKTTFTDKIIFIKMPTTETDYYGLPEYLPGFDDIHLINAAKNLRRQFYTNNGYLGGVFGMNVPVTDVDPKTGTSKTEKGWADNIISSVTAGKKLWLFNLRGNRDIEDIAKSMAFFNLAQDLKKDDFEKTAKICSQSILNSHRMDPDLMGTERSQGGVANLEKVLKNFSDTQIDFHQDKIELLINSHLEPEDWISFDRFYKSTETQVITTD